MSDVPIIRPPLDGPMAEFADSLEQQLWGRDVRAELAAFHESLNDVEDWTYPAKELPEHVRADPPRGFAYWLGMS